MKKAPRFSDKKQVNIQNTAVRYLLKNQRHATNKTFHVLQIDHFLFMSFLNSKLKASSHEASNPSVKVRAPLGRGETVRGEVLDEVPKTKSLERKQ